MRQRGDARILVHVNEVREGGWAANACTRAKSVTWQFRTDTAYKAGIEYTGGYISTAVGINTHPLAYVRTKYCQVKSLRPDEV